MSLIILKRCCILIFRVQQPDMFHLRDVFRPSVQHNIKKETRLTRNFLLNFQQQMDQFILLSHTQK